MDAPAQGRRQCTAKSTTTGERCTKAPIRGGTVCATHGGSAPPVPKKAALRLLELVDPAIAVLAREMVNADQSADPPRAANSVLDPAGVPRKATVSDGQTAPTLLPARTNALRGDADLHPPTAPDTASPRPRTPTPGP